MIDSKSYIVIKPHFVYLTMDKVIKKTLWLVTLQPLQKIVSSVS